MKVRIKFPLEVRCSASAIGGAVLGLIARTARRGSSISPLRAAFAVALLVGLTAADTALGGRAAPSFVIVGDTSIGGFHPYKMHGRLSQAIAVFGEPSTIRRRAIDSACVARWPELGLSMSFNHYAKTCVPERSCFFEAIVTGRSWRTAKGLRIGDSRRLLYQLYPKVKTRGEWRALLIRPGFEGTYPALSAKLIRLRVAAFRVEVGSCEGFFP